MDTVSEREQLAVKTVRRYMLWSTGAALIPVPFADIVALLAAQLKMVAALSRIYDIPFEKSRMQAVVGALLGYILPESLSEGLWGSLLKTIPGVGVLVGIPSFTIFVAAYTWALGHVFIMHFESGGTFLDFNPDAVKAHFRTQFEEGRKISGSMEAGERAEA